MPTPSDIRAQVLLQLKGEGQGEADKIAQALAQVRLEEEKLRKGFVDGSVAADEYKKGLTRLRGEIAFLEKQQDEVVLSLGQVGEAAKKLAAEIEESARRQARAVEEEEAAYVKLMQAVANARATEAKLNAKAVADAERDAAAKAKALEKEEAEYVKLAYAIADARALEEKLGAKAAADAVRDAAIKEKALAAEEAALWKAAVAQDKADTARVRSAAEAETKTEAEMWKAATAQDKVDTARVRSAAEAAAERVEEEAKAETKIEAEMWKAAVAQDKVDTERLRRAREASESLAAKEKAAAEELAVVRRKSAAEAEAEMIRADMLVEQHLAKQEAMAETIRRVNAREGAGLSPTDALTRQYAAANREQEHLNDLIAEGASLQVDAAASIDKVTVAQRNKTFEVQRDADGMSKYVQVTDASTRANTSHAEQAEAASRKIGYGILNVAHAMQDAQYGFGAVLNNIPLVVQAMGGGPGLAGTVMVAGVGISLMAENLKGLARDIGLLEDPTNKSARSLSDLKDKIKAIEAKPYKLEIDYQAIHAATVEVEALEKRLGAFKAAMGDVTDVQEKVAKSVKKAVSEEAGGTDDKSGAENLLNLIKLTMQKSGPDAFIARHSKFGEMVNLREELKDLEARKPQDLDEAKAIGDTMATVRAELAKLRDKMTRETEQATMATIGDAMLGRGKGIDYILDFMAKSRGTFEQGGTLVDPSGKKQAVTPVSPIFQAALEQSRAAEVKRVEEEEAQERRDEAKRQGRDFRRKLANDRIDKLKALEGDAPGDLQRMRDASINSDISTFGAMKMGHGGLLADETLGMVAGGKTPKQIREALLPGEVERLRAGGVDPKTLEEVARGIINNIVPKVMADVTSRDKNPQAGARKMLADDDAKAGAKEAAAGKRAAAAGGKQDARARTLGIAGQIGQEFGGELSDAQAMQGAEMYQKLVKGGANPAAAQARTFAKMNEFIAEQVRAMAMLNGGNAQMEQMLEAALQRMQMLNQQAQMIEGRVGNIRAKGAIVPNTIPVRRR